MRHEQLSDPSAAEGPDEAARHESGMMTLSERAVPGSCCTTAAPAQRPRSAGGGSSQTVTHGLRGLLDYYYAAMMTCGVFLDSLGSA